MSDGQRVDLPPEEGADPEQLLPLYALDALAAPERARVEDWLSESASGRAELARLRRVAAELPFATRPLQPRPATKAALLRRVSVDARRGRRESRRGAQRDAGAGRSVRDGTSGSGRPRPWLRWLGGLGLAAAVVVAGLAIQEVGRLDERAERLAEQRDDARATADALDGMLATVTARAELERALAAGLAVEGAEEVALGDPEERSGAGARFVAAAERGAAVLVVDDLPSLTPDQTYQLWLIEGETPESAGTFRVDETGRAVVPVPEDANLLAFEAVGVSIEPEGGSEAPTGPIVLLGARN